MNTSPEDYEPPVLYNFASAESVPLFTSPEKQPRTRHLTSFCCSSRNFATFLFALMSVTGQIAQYVSLPLWIDSTSQSTVSSTNQSIKWKPTVDSYFVASFAALSFVIVFGFALLCCNIICPNNFTEIDWSYRRLLLLLGSIQGVSALFIVFSSSGKRTPPYLQAILGNFSIPITLLFR